VSQGEPKKSRWNPMVVIPLAIIALGLAGVLGYTMMSPPAMDTPAATPDSRWMREIAQRTGGDVKKLSPEELARLQKITNGQGERALRFIVNPRTEFPQMPASR